MMKGSAKKKKVPLGSPAVPGRAGPSRRKPAAFSACAAVFVEGCRCRGRGGRSAKRTKKRRTDYERPRGEILGHSENLARVMPRTKTGFRGIQTFV
jgi:hypothetical protein